MVLERACCVTRFRAAFTSLNLGTPVLRTLGSLNCRGPSPVRTRYVPRLLGNHSILNVTRAKDKGATTFSLPLLRGLSPRLGTPRVLILTPAHRLTMRITRTVASFSGRVHNMGIITLCNNRHCSIRLHTLHRKPRVIINAPNHLLSRLGHNALSLSGLDNLILSRTSRVLHVNFVRSIRAVVTRVPRNRRATLFSTAVPRTVHHVAHHFVGRPRRIHVRSDIAAHPSVDRDC